MAPPDPPRATYRLQFSRDFTFRDAERLVPYLHALGVSHIYASPYLKARAGSSHGYDITDYNALNPEIGDTVDFDALVAALARHGMGQILDFVPNHMGVGRTDNAWWLDILEWGQASPYADYFDIGWNAPKPDLRGKVLLPFLGDHYGAILEAGELVPAFDEQEGSFSVWYHEHRFPLAPRSYGAILATAAAGTHARLGELAAAFRKLRTAAAPRRARAAMHARSWIDRLISIGGLSMTVIPEFVSSIALILIFGIALRWLPVTATAGSGAGPLDQLRHLILPAMPLVFVLFGYIARMARAGTIEALESDYARTATLKGLPRGVVIRRHVLRNALPPTITVVATQVGYLVGGLVIVETLFRYRGIGSLILTAAKQKDFPTLEAGVLVVGIVFVVFTMAADIILMLLNPRLRSGEH